MRLIISYILIAILQITILSCDGDDEQRTFTLEVINGTGSGDYPDGQAVSVAAHTPSDGKEFFEWTGDVQFLKSKTTAITTFKMPSRKASITATYKDLSTGTPVEISLDHSIKFQTIDGFGFFGGHDVWWGDASSVWNDAWGEKVISDLGISIWRNEYYPPATPEAAQDATWEKQKPVVEGLKAKADKYGVDLKFIFTVWSPPADLKWQASIAWAGDENATRNEGPVTTKNGGTLNPNKYSAYAAWLKEGIALYKESGVDLYALSPQNELMFSQPYNSCTYTSEWYNDMLKAVIPSVRETYPNVKIFGSENMLDMEGATINWPYFYHAGLKADEEASAALDILAVHGYSDGIAPTSGSGLAERWTNHLEQFSQPLQKLSWMSETSGYEDSWLGAAEAPGALSLALDIHAGLYYGNISAWIWWQGSELGEIGKFNLMNGVNVGKKYYASKHFYRYIRPGAVRIKATANDSKVFVTAYEHVAKNTKTIVIINSDVTPKTIFLTSVGETLPESFNKYQTKDGNDNCSLTGTVSPGAANSFLIPGKSIVTLQAGGDSL